MEPHKRQGDLNAMLETINSCVSTEVNKDDGNAISQKIGECAALLSLSSESVALAGLIYNERLYIEFKELPPKMSTTDKKLALAGILATESYHLKHAERLNASLVHALDGFRSMLSYLKEEIKMSGYAPNVQ